MKREERRVVKVRREGEGERVEKGEKRGAEGGEK